MGGRLICGPITFKPAWSWRWGVDLYVAQLIRGNIRYFVVIVSSVLVRIANGGKTLALNSSVELCYSKDDTKIPRWLPKFNMATVFHEETVLCDN